MSTVLGIVVIICFYQCLHSAFSCECPEQRIEAIEVIRGDNVTFNATFHMALYSSDFDIPLILHWKRGEEEIGLCNSGKCLTVIGGDNRHRFTICNVTLFSVSISNASCEDTGEYSFEIRNLGNTTCQCLICELIVRERKPVCGISYRYFSGSEHSKLACEWQEQESNNSETEIDRTLVSFNISNTVRAVLTMRDSLPTNLVPNVCFSDFGSTSLMPTCNFSISLTSSLNIISKRNETKVLSLRCCSRKENNSSIWWYSKDRNRSVSPLYQIRQASTTCTFFYNSQQTQNYTNEITFFCGEERREALNSYCPGKVKVYPQSNHLSSSAEINIGGEFKVASLSHCVQTNITVITHFGQLRDDLTDPVTASRNNASNPFPDLFSLTSSSSPSNSRSPDVPTTFGNSQMICLDVHEVGYISAILIASLLVLVSYIACHIKKCSRNSQCLRRNHSHRKLDRKCESSHELNLVGKEEATIEMTDTPTCPALSSSVEKKTNGNFIGDEQQMSGPYAYMVMKVSLMFQIPSIRTNQLMQQILHASLTTIKKMNM